MSWSAGPASLPPQAHTAAKLVAVVRTVRVAVAEPCAWDTQTIQRAAQLAFRAGLGPAVETILVAVRAVIHDVTRGAAASGYLSTWGYRVSQVPNTHPRGHGYCPPPTLLRAPPS